MTEPSRQRTSIVYARAARVQLSLPSYLALMSWTAVSLGVVYGLFIAVIELRNPRPVVDGELTSLGWLSNLLVHGVVAAVLVWLTALLAFPAYRWHCERRRGHRLRGKFAVLPDAADDVGKPEVSGAGDRPD